MASTEVRMINKDQILIGVGAMLLGLLFYLVNRPPGEIYFIEKLGLLSVPPPHSFSFGSLGNCLPSFLHVFSLILMTAGLMGFGKRGCLGVTAAWFFLDAAFELGQKYGAWSASMVPDWFSGVPFFENASRYFLTGVFDWLDVCALVIGALTAFLVVTVTSERRDG